MYRICRITIDEVVVNVRPTQLKYVPLTQKVLISACMLWLKKLVDTTDLLFFES